MYTNKFNQKVYTIAEIKQQLIDLRNNTVICMQDSDSTQLRIIDKMYKQLSEYISDIYKSVI